MKVGLARHNLGTRPVFLLRCEVEGEQPVVERASVCEEGGEPRWAEAAAQGPDDVDLVLVAQQQWHVAAQGLGSWLVVGGSEVGGQGPFSTGQCAVQQPIIQPTTLGSL